MNRWTKMAAAAVLAFAAVGTFLIAIGGSSRVAYAEIKKQIQEAQSMTFTARMEGPTPITVKFFMKGPGRMRQEMGGGAVAVMDFERKRGVTLVPEHKIAVVMNLDIDPGLLKQQMQQAQPFKELLDGEKQDLGEVESGGLTTRGYRVRKDGQTLDLWVDAKTGTPHRMELPGMKLAITEIRLNPELDDALFTLDVPVGYQVRERNMDLSKTTEKDLVAGLEFIAKYNDGKFPDQPMITLDLVEKMKKAASTITKEDEARFGELLGRMMMFPAKASQAGGKFVYAGKGKMLGDKTAAVAWWKLKDAAKYRVLYGDLRVEDAEESQLPPAPGK
jgi:outer membrane lipoprotein-sorting protein